MNPIYEEEYQDLIIKIYQDECVDSPGDWGDDSLFLVGYHRNFTVDRGQRELITIFKEEDFKNNEYKGRVYADNFGWKSYEEAKNEGLLNKKVRSGRYVPGISQELAQRIARGGKHEDGSISSEAKDYIKNYHIFGLEAYIHSDVTLALSHEGKFPDREWDVSQLGLVFASKKQWRIRRKARESALNLIEVWNDYLSGNVYYINIEQKDGTLVDSLGNIYGDYQKNALKEAKLIVDQLTNKGTTDHQGQLKLFK